MLRNFIITVCINSSCSVCNITVLSPDRIMVFDGTNQNLNSSLHSKQMINKLPPQLESCI